MNVVIAQGDDYVAMTEEDVEITKESFSGAPPELFRAAHRYYEKEMMTTPKVQSNVLEAQKGKVERREQNIMMLDKSMKLQYAEVEKWTDFLTGEFKQFAFNC